MISQSGGNICNLTFANPVSNEILLVSRVTHRALTASQWKANDTVNQWVWDLNAQLRIKMGVVSKLMLRGVTALEGGLAVPQSASGPHHPEEADPQRQKAGLVVARRWGLEGQG